jgi:hypothetical protein
MENEEITTTENSEQEKQLTPKQEEALQTFSSIAALAGLTVSVLAAFELSVPVMIIAAVAGASSAVAKLIAAKYSMRQDDQDTDSETDATKEIDSK